MAVSALDTHELVKDLKSAGFTEDQAEAVTRAVKQAQEVDFSDFATKFDLVDLATKADLSGLSARADQLSVRMDQLSARVDHLASKADLADARAELIKWMFTIVLGQGALVVALLKLLPGHF